MVKKVTKKDVLNALATFNFSDVTLEDGTVVTSDDVKNYIDVTLGQLDAKAIKAKEKANEKKAASDELKATIKSVLTNEYQTLAQIVEAIDIPEVTNAKVVARLGQLVKSGEVIKEDVKIDNRTLKGYALASVDAE